MKIKDGFIMNRVGNQHVVVPVGDASVERHCMVRLNDTGAFFVGAARRGRHAGRADPGPAGGVRRCR